MQSWRWWVQRRSWPASPAGVNPTCLHSAGVQDLPDWGKLIFPEKQGSGLAAALPGAPPAALELLAGLLQYNPGKQGGSRGA